MKKYKLFEYELTPFATDEDEQALQDWIDSLGQNPTEIPDVDDEHYEKWCSDYDFHGVKTLIVPESIKRIGKCAFAQSLLKNLIAEGVEVIDELAFYHTGRLYSVSAPKCKNLAQDCFNHSAAHELNLNSVEKVGRYCFYDMPRIKIIALLNLREMDPYAIYGCKALMAVNLGKLENAEFSIISNNNNLELIKAQFLRSRDLLAIHSNAKNPFVDCELASVIEKCPTPSEYDSETLERAMEKEEFEYQYQHPHGYKFNLVSGLDDKQTKRVISELNKQFNVWSPMIANSENAGKDESAIDVFKFLKDIYLPEEIKSIGDYAFAKCYKLESVVAPGVGLVGDHAFYCDGALRYIDIPKCIYLESDAFNGAGFDTHTKIFAPEILSIEKHSFWQTGFVCLDMPRCEKVAPTAIEENDKLIAVRVASLKYGNAINVNPKLVKLVVENGKKETANNAVYACPCITNAIVKR